MARPSKMNPDIVGKLVAAFARGYNDTEACDYAGINRDTYYEWLKKDSEFADKITSSKMRPNMKAKEVVLDAIENGDVKSSQWWLDRKARDEFATRQEMTGQDGEKLFDTRNELKEIGDELKEALNGTEPGNPPSGSADSQEVS